MDPSMEQLMESYESALRAGDGRVVPRGEIEQLIESYLRADADRGVLRREIAMRTRGDVESFGQSGEQDLLRAEARTVEARANLVEALWERKGAAK